MLRNIFGTPCIYWHCISIPFSECDIESKRKLRGFKKPAISQKGFCVISTSFKTYFYVQYVQYIKQQYLWHFGMSKNLIAHLHFWESWAICQLPTWFRSFNLAREAWPRFENKTKKSKILMKKDDESNHGLGGNIFFAGRAQSIIVGKSARGENKAVW